MTSADARAVAFSIGAGLVTATKTAARTAADINTKFRITARINSVLQSGLDEAKTLNTQYHITDKIAEGAFYAAKQVDSGIKHLNSQTAPPPQ